ncbi:MAG: bifunctional DNA-formamidopyrimidine glycosylase/DNA-(apurinic or apyrimidinic site) lyase [Patescibacteria group bacterium]
MPELPEVETIKRDLSEHLINKKIIDFICTQKSLLRSPLSLFKRVLVGATVKSVNRRAKLLYFELSNSYYLLIHLKMTGQLVYRTSRGKLEVGGHPIDNIKDIPNRFTYITLVFKDGGKLFFNDVRKFGYFQIASKNELFKILTKYGPEPLSADFSLNIFKQNLKRRARTTIKAALLDQSIVAGLGNIYVDECLFTARIKPSRRTGSLSSVEIVKLHQAIKFILKKAVKSRGTSFNSYRDGLGRKGTYWEKRLVYGRGGEKCLKCDTVIKKMKVAGRGTHYCSACQK